MSRRASGLPGRSSLEPWEQLAETIARAYAEGDATAIRELNWTYGTGFVWDHDPDRMRRRLPTWYASSPRPADLALADARLLVAKHFGFDAWEDLVAGVRASRAGGGARGGAPNATAPSWHVNEAEGSVHVRGPMSDADWDRMIGVMEERSLSSLHGAGQIGDTALRRLARLEHVTRLDMGGAKRCTAEGVRHLARLPLRSLEMGGWGTEVDDEMLEVLRELPELRSVSLVWARRISDRGTVHLAACPALESVNLMGTPTGDPTLRALAGKARLGALDAGTGVTPAGLGALSDFPLLAAPLPGLPARGEPWAEVEVTHLALHPAAFVRGGLETLAGLRGLRSLRLFSIDRAIPPVTDAALRPLVRMEGLGSLWCDPSADAMAVISRLPRLRRLMCQDTAAGDAGWVALGRSRTIEGVWGRRNTGLRDTGLRALARMPALRSLGVNLERVGDEALAALAEAPALRELTPIGLGDEGFRHVGACRALEKLTCMYTDRIGDGATAHLAGLDRLRSYYAGDTEIGDRSLELLAKLPSLETVELWDCPAVTAEGLAALAGAPRLRRVTVEVAPRVTRAAAALFPPGVDVHIGW